MDPTSNYYDMNFWQQMLGLAGNPYYPYYQAPKMQYVGMGGQQQGQQQKQSSNPMSTYNNIMKMMSGGPTATGMTPNATNPAGESFYGWGSQTGDWGATAGASTPGSATVGNGLVAGNEIPFSEMGADLGGSVGAESGGGSYLGYMAPVLAAIAGQHMMSGATDRRTMEGGKQGADVGQGHRTGDIFSGNFFTEPWMAWGEQQLGIDTPTAGEKTDASIDRLREGKGGFSDFASTVPGTAYQWFDPVGNFAGDFMGDKFGTAGKVATSIFLPQTALKWGADWLSGLF
jgi:hypothetical protein